MVVFFSSSFFDQNLRFLVLVIPSFVALKWASQVLILLSGIGAIFWDATKKDPSSQKRRLTVAGAGKVAAMVIGLALFVATDGKERAAKNEQIEEQKRQVAERERDLSFQRDTTTRQDKTIRVQQNEMDYLHHLVLVQEQLGGWEISWRVPASATRDVGVVAQRVLKLPARESKELNNPSYFATCLRLGLHALRISNDRWLLRCTLGRPQGTLNLKFELEPQQEGWKAFEAIVDALLSHQFSIAQAGGQDLAAFDEWNRPPELEYLSHGDISLIIRNPGIRLSRFEKAKIVMRVKDPQNAPTQIRLRSLDPNVEFSENIRLHWVQRRVGSVWDGETEEEQPVYAFFSGPHKLNAGFNKLLFPSKSAAE